METAPPASTRWQGAYTPIMQKTRAVFQLAMFWSNSFAFRNMLVKSIALATFHELMSWLKTDAL